MKVTFGRSGWCGTQSKTGDRVQIDRACPRAFTNPLHILGLLYFVYRFVDVTKESSLGIVPPLIDEAPPISFDLRRNQESYWLRPYAVFLKIGIVMNSDELKALQAPVKAGYKDDPDSAIVKMTVSGELNPKDLTCSIVTHAGNVTAGLHPAAGGDGSHACSGDMLLESLVACAGVTLRAVATAMGIPISAGSITAEGTMDFRGTLGVSRETPVGLTDIRLIVNLDSTESAEKVAKLVELTERYCVIYQTLKNPPKIATQIQ